MRVFGRTDEGRVRPENQDAYVCGRLSDQTVFAIVCDGMGGANGGNVASAIAIKVISDRILDVYRDGMNENSLRNMLESAISAANIEIFDASMADLELRGMGTTVVAVIVSAILVSRHVFDFLGLRMRAVGRRTHMPATMWAFVLTGLHIGLHWHIVLGKLGKAGNRAGVWLCRLVLVCVIAFGAWEFATRGLWMELFILRESAFLAYEEPLAIFFASYAAILFLWVALA